MPFFGVPIRNGLPIGLGSVAGFGVQQFDPSQLFEGGTVAGAWYDPSDLSTMFDTSAGTTPVAMPGQGAAVPVGAMLDKRATGYSNYFDGSGDNLNTATSSAFAFGTGDFTLSAFIYPTTTTGTQIIIDCRAATVNNPGPVIYLNGTTLSSAKNQSTVINSGGTVAANQWSFVELTRTSGDWRLFLNGSLVAGPTTDTINYTDNSAAYIAKNAITAIQYFSGYISNVRVLKGVGGTTSIVPTAPLSPITGTSLLTCGVTWSGNPAITTVGNTRVDGLNPFTASPVGNHAISFNNTTARPELRARVNLLTYSEEFDNGAWTASNLTVTANTAVAPDGTTTADTLDDASASFGALSQIVSSLANSAYNFSVYIKSSGVASNVRIDLYTTVGDQFFAIFNSGTGAYVSGNGGTYTTTSVGNGWYRVSLSASGSGNTTVRVYPAGGSAGATGSIFIWGADLRPANIGANVPAYQRIADANTYDTSGFPLYLRFDGIDDSMYTPANLNLSGTDKVAVFAGVRKLSDAAFSVVSELSAVATSNNGSFLVAAPNAAGPRFAFYSRGTLTVAAEINNAAYAAPISNVFTGLGDISGDSALLRLNGVQVGSNTSDQGSGNYGTYPLFIGARNNAGNWFNGHLHSLIIAGSAVSAGNISATEQWVAGRTGIQI